ncbi:MAG: PIN domain-containing protein [Capnocytophaga leadbetteri]|jgi:hypothetical protein
MIIIADSNIFMSALLSPKGTIASILAERKRIQFVVPDYLIKEVNEHIPDLVKRLRGNKTKKQLITDFKQLLEGVTIVEEKDVKKVNAAKAREIVADVDMNDYPFIALHLEIKHKIWTSDDRLKEGLTKKGYAHFFISTKEVIAQTYKKSIS